MKSIGGAEGKKTDKKEESEPAVKIDLSKVKVEPLFEDAVDFDTFSKSDFRVVKVEACEAVPKSQEAPEVHAERRNRPETHDFKRNSRVLRAGRAGRKDLCRHRKSAAEEDDGYRLRGYADQCGV